MEPRPASLRSRSSLTTTFHLTSRASIDFGGLLPSGEYLLVIVDEYSGSSSIFHYSLQR